MLSDNVFDGCEPIFQRTPRQNEFRTRELVVEILVEDRHSVIGATFEVFQLFKSRVVLHAPITQQFERRTQLVAAAERLRAALAGLSAPSLQVSHEQVERLAQRVMDLKQALSAFEVARVALETAQQQHMAAEEALQTTQQDWQALLTRTAAVLAFAEVEAMTPHAQFEHEATTTKLSEDQLFYLRQRGLPQEEAVALLVNGFVRDVLQKLPMEFAVEAQKLVAVSLEGSVG